ncbi:MAG: V-type ATP synthase subunit I [Candidatus Ranarchaeia archaeon]
MAASSEPRNTYLLPERMEKIRALILDDYIEPVLSQLQQLNSVHFVSIQERQLRWNKQVTQVEAPDSRRWQRLLVRLEEIMDRLKLRRDLGLLQQLFLPREKPLYQISFEREQELLNSAEPLITEIEAVIHEKIDRFNAIRGFLEKISHLDLELSDLVSSERILIKIGRLPPESLTVFQDKCSAKLDAVATYTVKSGRSRIVIIITPMEYKPDLDELLEAFPFREIKLPVDLSGKPSEYLAQLQDTSDEIVEKYQENILMLYDAIKAKLKRLEIFSLLGRSDRLYAIEGWVPVSEETLVHNTIISASKGHALVRFFEADEPVKYIPTLLKNRKLVGHFRILTDMYGAPTYNEIDPTPFFAFFFTIFVGLMAADIAIGATFFLAGLLIIRGAGTRSKSMKSLGVVLACTGVAATMFGFLMGEFSGGLIHLPVYWISSAEQPIDFLFFAVALGIVHLVLGTFLGIYNNLMSRQFRKLLGEQLSVLLLFGGVGIILLSGNLSLSAPTTVIGVATIVAGLGALIIGQGPVGFLDITRLLSSVISYVRIMAINLASAWMSRTFVLLSTLLFGFPFVGIGLSIILLIFSHFFIVFISSFATFAHSLRLHYVEFYGRFFVGGGLKFSPLESTRNYTVLKIENVTS